MASTPTRSEVEADLRTALDAFEDGFPAGRARAAAALALCRSILTTIVVPRAMAYAEVHAETVCVRAWSMVRTVVGIVPHCEACGGTGAVEATGPTLRGITVPCPACGGRS